MYPVTFRRFEKPRRNAGDRSSKEDSDHGTNSDAANAITWKEPFGQHVAGSSQDE